uniref:BAR/IMD domain-containing adapter protein 2-like isoform X2 n=1 Tax=Myxine glutinosa TaxID=7769 RepID=UPI00358F75CF
MSLLTDLNRQTEAVYKNVSDQFNPCLRSFMQTGRTYEKALSNVTVAAKGYFNSLVKLGELASHSKGSKQLGDSLFEMAEVHRQIQMQMEESIKTFRGELLLQLEQKLDLDLKFLSATVKRHQSEHKLKAELLDKTSTKLHKLRRRSRNSKRPDKYSDREKQVEQMGEQCRKDYEAFVSEGFRSAVVEERRRFSFLVERQCAVAREFSLAYEKARDLLNQKLPEWQQSCAHPTRLPECALEKLRKAVTGGLKTCEPPSEMVPSEEGDDASVVDLVSPIDAAPSLAQPPKTTSTEPTPAASKPLVGVANEVPAALGTTEFATLASLNIEADAKEDISRSVREGYSTLPSRRPGERPSILPGDDGTLLSFAAGDTIRLLVPEARGGWQYGEHESTRKRGWFPFAYTEDCSHEIHNIRPGSVLGGTMVKGRPADDDFQTFKARPYSIAVAGDFNIDREVNGRPGAAFPLGVNPFASIKLRPTVTNDRSAPLIK